MSTIPIKFRSDSFQNWQIAQEQQKGNLSKGEIGISYNTNTNEIELIGRIGVHEIFTPFDSCPILFKTTIQIGENQDNYKFLQLNEALNDEARIILYDKDQNKFIAKKIDEFIEIPENYIVVDEKDLDGYLKWNGNFWITEKIGTDDNQSIPNEIEGGDWSYNENDTFKNDKIDFTCYYCKEDETTDPITYSCEEETIKLYPREICEEATGNYPYYSSSDCNSACGT